MNIKGRLYIMLGNAVAVSSPEPYKLWVYLCSKCDKVHLTVAAEAGDCVAFDLDHAQADELAALLLNPPTQDSLEKAS